MVNIMVVEDEKPISNLIALSLKKAGYHRNVLMMG